MAKIDSPFCVTLEKEARGDWDKEYISFMEVEKVKEGFDPSRPHEFIIEKEFIEDERIPIEQEINAHRNRVGLKNMLKGVVDSRQMKDLIARTQSNGLFVDGTKMPSSDLEMEKLVGSIDRIWDSIPAELKGTLTKEEFIASFTADKLKTYVKNAVSKEEAEKGEK